MADTAQPLAPARGLTLGRTRAEVAGAAVLMLLAWLLYRPEQARPFDALDFGEILPLLKRSSGMIAQYASVSEYSALHSGRVTPIPIAAMVFKWNLFGMWTPGWQLTHAVVLLVAMWQTHALLRRFGATTLGGLMGASVFLLAPAAASSWVRLTTGEPIGTVLMLALTLRATSFQRTDAWRRDVAVFCVGASAVLLTKELLAPVLILPLIVALTYQPDDTFARPRMTRRNTMLVGAVAAVSIATTIPLVSVYLQASSSAFAAQFGQSFQSVGRVVANWISTLIPFDLIEYPGSAAWLLAIIGFTVLLASGWRIGFHDPVNGRRARILLAGAVLFTLIGAVIYLPWQQYEDRYAYPYLIGTAVVVGMAMSYMERLSRAGLTWGLLSSLLVFTFAASGAWLLASRADAWQRTADALIASVATTRDIDSVLVVADARPVGLEWTGPGPSLSRLAAATERPWPPTRDIRCADGRQPSAQEDRVAIVVFFSMCGNQSPTRRVISYYRRLDQRWMVRMDSVHADIRGRAAAPHDTLRRD